VSSTSTPDTASATPEEPAAEPEVEEPQTDATPDAANDNIIPLDQTGTE
jgi:hypothetical protein